MNIHILRQQTGIQNILHRAAAGIPRHRTLSCASSEGQVKVKVKFTLEQAMKAQRGSRGIALLFL
jgi:hypothetical protein